MFGRVNRIILRRVMAVLKKVKRELFFTNKINEMNFKVGVEVGTDKGYFANVLLSSSNLDILYCVDLYPDNLFGITDGQDRFIEAKSALSNYVNNGRAVFKIGESAEVSKRFEDGSVDFCYIDADHSYDFIVADLKAWYPKVKPGGVLSGHDYKSLKKCGVERAVNEFCEEHGYELTVIGHRRARSWSIVKHH